MSLKLTLKLLPIRERLLIYPTTRPAAHHPGITSVNKVHRTRYFNLILLNNYIVFLIKILILS